MTSTTILTEDSAAIVADDVSRFSWGITIAGAVAAIATTFLLTTLGAGVGLAFLPTPSESGVTTFLTLAAIYFLASQAFGFAVGGYLVGRLIGPQVENTKEEEFRAAAHGFAMWAVVVVACILLIGAFTTITGSAVVAGAASNENPSASSQAYWVDDMFRPAPYSAQTEAHKAEAGRILGASMGKLSNSDADRIARLIAQDAGISPQASLIRVYNSHADMRAAADKARHAASIFSLWTAFALLFGLATAVAAAIAARWMDDRISFSFAPRRQMLAEIEMMNIQVRYFLCGHFIASLPAKTMFEARRIAEEASAIPADAVSIFAISQSGELELESRALAC